MPAPHPIPEAGVSIVATCEFKLPWRSVKVDE